MKLNNKQIKFLNRGSRGTWSINEKTGLVDINGSFKYNFEKLKDFKGVRFGVVTGSFECHGNNLTSLEGAPKVVGGDFSCSYNELTSLEGAPQEVSGFFSCQGNNLTSLEGAPPKKVADIIKNISCTISHKTLNLVWNTMQEKKIDYWTALVILKNNIEKNDFNKLSVGLDERLSKDTQRGISMMSRFGHFD